MMRWVLFSVAVVGLTASAAVLSSLVSAPPSVETGPILTGRDREVPNGPPGSITVTEPLVYEFGFMPQRTEGTRDWTITNTGTGPLKLRLGNVTCSCTIPKLDKKEGGKEAIDLAPGGSTKLTLTWNTKSFTEKYRQSADLLVFNDPKNDKVVFSVEGTIRASIVTFPPERVIDFAKVENDGPHPHGAAIVSFDRPETKLTGVTTTNPAVLNVALSPLSDDEASQFQVEKGNKLVVTLAPGAPLGSFLEDVVVTTDHPLAPRVEFKVAGKLGGPISPTPDRVLLLDVDGKVGGSQELTVWVRGQKTTKFTVDKKPKDYEVEIVPAGEAETGSASRYKMIVKVPPGLPPGGTTGEILIKTDHPQAAELKIPVTVRVRAS